MTTNISFINVTYDLEREIKQKIIKDVDEEDLNMVNGIFKILCNLGHIERDDYGYDELNEIIYDYTFGTIFVEGGSSIIINLNVINLKDSNND